MLSPKKPDLSELRILQLEVTDNAYQVSRERIRDMDCLAHNKKGALYPIVQSHKYVLL